MSLLEPIGVIVGGFAIIWRMSNTSAFGPGPLIAVAMAALIAGGALS